jgi:hypothetical protein
VFGDGEGGVTTSVVVLIAVGGDGRNPTTSLLDGFERLDFLFFLSDTVQDELGDGLEWLKR